MNLIAKSILNSAYLVCAILLFGFYTSWAQSNPQLEELLRTPYVSNLNVSKEHNRIVYTINKAGKRNVYMADGPHYKSSQVTDFKEDDGQEITSLQLSANGEYAVFVRGGDHGGNSSPVPINPNSSIDKQELALYSIHLKTKDLIKIDKGDYPVVHPFENKMVYSKSSQLWISSIGNTGKAKPLFSEKGSSSTPQWSPDGKKLAFVSRRNTHSFIGVYEEEKRTIEWVAPSFYIDNTPRWSPDGNSIAFIRRRASGGARDSITVSKPVVWDIMTYNFNKEELATIYSTPNTLKGSLPRIAGATNLNWPLKNELTFMSYQDGWPHLYKVNAYTKEVIQQTKGNFEIKQLNYNEQGNKVLFAANHGEEAEDCDRVHVGLANLEENSFKMLTNGVGIEVSPQFLGKGNEIVYLKGGVGSPFLPEVKNLSTEKVIRVASEEINNSLYENFVIPEQVSFTSSDGVKVNAQLFSPRDGKENKPALVYIHGGPRRQMYLGWHNMDYYHYDYITNQYLASQGFVVLSVNYRMGTGYGFDFQNPSNVGNLGAQEYLDILAAGKWLQNQNNVDPQNIGLFGGSYGGYLTALGLGKNSELFKYGVDVHGVHNRERANNLSFYPPDYDLAARLSWESSPSKYVSSWTSPVLIIHGDDDKNVAFSQSLDLVNRLLDKGVETEFLVIPDETHHWMLQRNLEKIKTVQVEYLLRKARK